MVSKHGLAIFLIIVWLFLPVFVYYIGEYAVSQGLTNPNYISDINTRGLNISQYQDINFYSGTDIFIIGIQNIPLWLDALVMTPLIVMTGWLIAAFIRGD